MLTRFGTPDLTLEFMISPINYYIYLYYIMCQSWDYVFELMTGLFAWISLTALSHTYFILGPGSQTEHDVAGTVADPGGGGQGGPDPPPTSEWKI